MKLDYTSEFGALLDRSANLDVYFVFINGRDWLFSQKWVRIQLIPGVVKCQNKPYEIKSTVARGLLKNFY